MGRVGVRSKTQAQQGPPPTAVLKMRRASRLGTPRLPAALVTSSAAPGQQLDTDSIAEASVGRKRRLSRTEERPRLGALGSTTESAGPSRQRTIPEVLERKAGLVVSTPKLELPRLDLISWGTTPHGARRLTPEAADIETPVNSAEFVATPFLGEGASRDAAMGLDAGIYRTPTFTIATAVNANWMNSQAASAAGEDSNASSTLAPEQGAGASQPPPSPSPALKRLHLLNGSANGRWCPARESNFSAPRPPLQSQRYEYQTQAVATADMDAPESSTFSSQMHTQTSVLSQDTLGMLLARRRAVQAARTSTDVVGRITFSQAGDDEAVANGNSAPGGSLSELRPMTAGIPTLVRDHAMMITSQVPARSARRPTENPLWANTDARTQSQTEAGPGNGLAAERIHRSLWGSRRAPATATATAAELRDSFLAMGDVIQCTENGRHREAQPTSAPIINPFLVCTDEPETPSKSEMSSAQLRPNQLLPEVASSPSRFLQQFEEVQILGSGVKGQVLLARHRTDGCLYAVKRTTRPLLSRTDRFDALREVHALAAVGAHENIVRYHTAWFEEHDTRLYLQLEYCAGGSMQLSGRTRLTTASKLPHYLRLVRLLGHVAAALAHCHAHGIAHMDVKPENMLIGSVRKPHQQLQLRKQPTKQEVFKLADFGLACRLDGADFTGSEGDSRYLCQSVLSEAPLGSLVPVDVFALGISIYELLTEQPLPTKGDEWQALRAGRLDRLDALTAAPGETSTDANLVLSFLIDWIRRCVQPSVQERPTAAEVALACETWLVEHASLSCDDP